MKIPQSLIKKIGSPQKIFRTLTIDGIDLLIRLQKPWEEPPEEFSIAFKMDDKGNITPLDPNEQEEWLEYGTCIIIESWSDATQSVVTHGIRKAEDQTEEEFSFSARYMMNQGNDEEWLQVIKAKGIDKIVKLACKAPPKFVEPTVKQKKKKT